ncbi:MAG TPA: tol-pal system protein YbgF [Burkholderiales bacterium]|jgi:tol-pal system protein YbgF
MTRFGAAALAVALLSPVNPAGAQSTQERLERIERQLEGRGLVDLLNQLEKLQVDVQQLHGEIEVQNHKLEDMQRQQRELYLDIDRRLQQLETGQPLAPGAAGGEQVPPPMVPDVAAPPTVASPPPVAAPPTPAAPPPVAPALDNTAEQQADYEKALAILRAGRYVEAASAFNQFLEEYPGSGYSDNAYYWLGETYYVLRDFNRALASFNTLVGNYPRSPKLPGAKLKIGYIHYEKQDWAEARQELNALVTGYPGTTEARLADDRLQRMKKEGH